MICHVTTVMCLFIINQKKINIKSRKINKKKRKILVFKYTIITNLSRLLTMDLTFIFHFSFYFILFCFSFIFLFLEQLGLGFIRHAVTSVTNWWCSHKTDHGSWKKKVEGSGTKWRHTAWTTHTGLMLYSWSFRVGCTVASTDHGW